MNTDTHNREIVQAVISLSRTLGLDVIAEGVETEEQLASLIADGCPQAQGYLLSRPLPQDKLDAFLEKRDDNTRGDEL